MTNVAKGMLVYDTTKVGFYFHDGGKWLPINQQNSDSLLRYTYPEITPVNSTMSVNGVLGIDGLYGTLYDNGGAAGNYASNSNGGYTVYQNDDSTALIKVNVVEMNIESPYDSLEIYSADDYEHKQLFTGNRMGTFYFTGGIDLEFRFRSNGVNNLPGFKINWTKLTPNSLKAEAPPLTGWYFNSGKIAARGGVNVNNNWATDSLGMYSFAYGQNALAKGDHSSALGSNSAASGKFSLAMGEGSIASGDRSVAVGGFNKANGNGSTALGLQNQTNRQYGTTLGIFNTTNNSYSTAVGYNNIVSGYSATAIGFGNKVDGDYSAVIGTKLIVKENRSYALGA